MDFLSRMENTLVQKYDTLYQAMYDYFTMYHSDVDQKKEKIESSKDIISRLSALYVAKEKENFKKEKLKEIHEWLKQFFYFEKR